MLEEKENMADFSEKWGTDVDTAVQLALADLKLTIDEVDVTVLEEPSRGFFGIGSKLALVRVEKKKKPEEKVQPQKADAPGKKRIIKKEVKKQVEKEPVVKEIKEEKRPKEKKFLKRTLKRAKPPSS